MFYNEDHLRITKVKTIDGISPLMGEDEKPQKKIIFAPLNPQTKKLFEEENTRKPNQLKMKIEVVKAYRPEPIPVTPDPEISNLEKRIKELEDQNKELLAAKLKENSEVSNSEKVVAEKPVTETNLNKQKVLNEKV